MSDIEYDPSGNSNFSLHVGADILNYYYYMSSLHFSMYNKYLDLITQLFSEFIKIVSILYYIYTFIELIMLLYTFLVISFDRYKE